MAKPKPRRPARAPLIPTTGQALATAMDLAASDGWAGLTAERMARAGGYDLAHMQVHWPDRHAVLDGLADLADQAMLDHPADEDDAPTDRLFEVLMARFDALAQFKPGLVRLAGDRPDPAALLCAAPRLVGAMRRAHAAARLPLAGPAAPLKLAGLAVIWGSVFRVWLGEAADDCPATMAALDRRLRQAEGWLAMLQPRKKSADGASADSA